MTTQALWQQFRDELDGFIRRRVADPVDAEDLRQQVYLQIHRHLARHEPPRHLRGWVHRIARNAIVDHHRRRAARLDPRGGGDVDVAAIAAEVDGDADANDAVRGLSRCLLSMVDRLDPATAQALRWVDLEGRSQQSAADEAGVSLSGMKSRVQRGRAKLRDAMLTCCEVEFDARHRPISHRCRNPRCDCDQHESASSAASA